MSFSFTAIGTKDEVARRLRHTDPVGEDGFNKAGREIALLIARHLEESDTGDYDYGYVVKASGHSSKTGSPFTLNVTVEPHWLPAVPDEAEGEAALD